MEVNELSGDDDQTLEFKYRTMEQKTVKPSQIGISEVCIL